MDIVGRKSTIGGFDSLLVSTKILQNKTIKNVYKTDTKVTEISNKYSENYHKLLLKNDYASDLKSLAGYSVPVQVRPRVPPTYR